MTVMSFITRTPDYYNDPAFSPIMDPQCIWSLLQQQNGAEMQQLGPGGAFPTQPSASAHQVSILYKNYVKFFVKQSM